MAERGLPGGAGDEMFFNNNSGRRSPTIEPLRIQKRDGISPEPRADSVSHSRPGYAFTPSFSPPPPASGAGGGPLPYPDDGPQRTNSSRLPYPDDGWPQPSSPGSRGSSPTVSIPQYPRPQPMASRPAERRGTGTKPLPDSPGPETPDKEGLFQRTPKRPGESTPSSATVPRPTYQAYHSDKPYYPPPDSRGASSSSAPMLQAPKPMNRFGSNASTATTKAQRGSPPPPETPVLPSDDNVGGIEARYAASGIPGTQTLTGLQAQTAQNAAAAQRANQYGNPGRAQNTSPPQQSGPQRPWTPTELPGSNLHGYNVVYQGSTQQPSPGRQQQASATAGQATAGQHPGQNPTALAEDIQRMHVSHSPPPAYSSLGRPSGATTTQGYPDEKAGAHSHPGTAAAAAVGATVGATTGAAVTAAANMAPAAASPDQHHVHPAYANNNQHGAAATTNGASQATQEHAPTAQPGPASPPPLPEGWIAHLDQNSGHYYYIHLPTQSTQWEFPKGPTPLNLQEPTSPVGGHFSGTVQSPGLSTFSKPMQSPGFAPSTTAYAESVTSLGSQAPTVTGFTGPPPSSGVDIYKVAPTNGVYFGPYLRYINMDQERGVWLGSILLVTDAPQPPTIHIHQTVDLSPDPRQLKPSPISKHQRWTFYRYDIDLQMEEHETKWTYAITSHLGCTRYEFVVAGRHEVGWRFIATSGNDFALNVSANERQRLGGVGLMWKDIMMRHQECGGFHAQLGTGDQIYADRIWREIPSLKQWLAISGKENRKNEPWTPRHEEDVQHAYFHYYTSHFDQPFLREAFAQIPYILQIDDHDIFDGFGSYPEYMQFSQMFKNIGRIGIDTYLLFQHHTTLEQLRNVSGDQDIFTITGTGWHFVKYLGPAVVVVGPDCRSERNPHQVMAGPTYQGIFPKVAMLPPSVQHCIWMISVPILYPRLETAEQIANTMATGKKAVTGAYNMLGKVTSSVAGVVGAKEFVGHGFDTVKKAVGKSGLMGSMLSPFGDVNMLDEFRDAWTHESKDLERTYLVRTLQGIAHQKSLRMTFLSGGVDCCGAGLVHDPSRPQDHKTMYQLISSSVVNGPPPSYVVRMLHSGSKTWYVPANGHRSAPNTPSDTKEDMMEIFTHEPDGRTREYKRLMGRRNYVALVAFDPDTVQGQFAGSPITAQQAHGHGGGQGSGKLSLAADFMVQVDGAQMGGLNTVTKYGPVIVPNLEFGR